MVFKSIWLHYSWYYKVLSTWQFKGGWIRDPRMDEYVYCIQDSYWLKMWYASMRGSVHRRDTRNSASNLTQEQVQLKTNKTKKWSAEDRKCEQNGLRGSSSNPYRSACWRTETHTRQDSGRWSKEGMDSREEAHSTKMATRVLRLRQGQVDCKIGDGVSTIAWK